MSFKVSDAYTKLREVCTAKHLQEQLPCSDDFGIQQLAAVQRLLLHPQLTVQIVTTFRPLVLHLVSKIIFILTKSSADFSKQPNRRINAQAAVALVTALELAPQCERQVVRYFEMFPQPFFYVGSTTSGQQVAADPGSRIDCPLLSQLNNLGPIPSDEELSWATLRGLQLSYQLRNLWRWASILSNLQHPQPEVRYCAARCTAITFGLGDSATVLLSQRVLTQQEELECSLRWQGAQTIHAAAKAASLVSYAFCTGRSTEQDLVNKAVQAQSQENIEGSIDSSDSRKRKFGCIALSPSHAATAFEHGGTPGYITLGGLELSVRESSKMGLSTDVQQARHARHPLISIPSAERNLESLVLGLCTGSPVLLQGPPGSGKSTMVEHIAGLTGNAEDMVRIHLDDQMDSKSLVGAYVCTSKPGEFAWQPGPLAQAVAHGRWVLVEDINLAPAEVLAALVPLLEKGTLYVAARAEMITAAPGFQLLATVTSAPGGTSSGAYGSSQGVRDLLGGLFHYVNVDPPNLQEQMVILGAKHPVLTSLLPHAMATLSLFHAAYGPSGSGLSSDQQQSKLRTQGGKEAGWDAAVHAALSAAGLRAGELGFSVGRHFSLRDLAKWCRRMEAVHSALLARSLKPGLYPEYQRSVSAMPLAIREAAFCEAADCFCGLVGKAEVAIKLLRGLCALWALPVDTVEQHTSLQKPALTFGPFAIQVGRATLPLIDTGVAARTCHTLQSAIEHKDVSRFAPTSHALRNMERVAVATSLNEPVLLVGETGTGKTTLVQQIAKQVGAKLLVLNLSQQTDSSDLLGGFKPVQPSDAVLPLLDSFCDLVRLTWWKGNNEDFLARVSRLAQKRKWGQLIKAFWTALEKVQKSEQGETASGEGGEGSGVKKLKRKAREKGNKPTAEERMPPGNNLDTAIREKWHNFKEQLLAAEASALAAEGGVCFAFMEGILLKAVREGWWLLLDEINLAPPEALERIAGLLEDADGSLVVTERGDAAPISRHQRFRLFAAMNPATDAGKRDLPAPLRNRFTEFWIDEPPSRADLSAIVAGYLAGAVAGAPIDAVVDFYLGAKKEAENSLQDGAGHKPAYNLRTLCRALEYAAAAVPVYGLQRALYDGFAMSFLTQLDPGSAPRLVKLMQQHLLSQKVSLKSLMRAPPTPPGPAHVLFDHFWVATGPLALPDAKESDGKGGKFVLTPAVSHHLQNLARAVLLRRYPILLQGPTSSGKTSLVAYLAAQTGHTFVRINNHEQTDLQEYLGSYISDESGRLVFKEGLLVQAVRQGHWIVLDELNLAPTEVLEALNRLLDDNRELYVPELQETVKPHPHFMLFATQNPPGIYAGRKILSRAFRSRFLELHVEDIPDNELGTILERRCSIAPSYASKLVMVMRELQRRRASSNVFAGRHGFITPRDLFRWAGRGAVGYQQLAEDGFAVLGERLRSIEERHTVQEVLQKVLGVKLEMEAVYQLNGEEPLKQLQAALRSADAAEGTQQVDGEVGPADAACRASSEGFPAAEGSSSSMADVEALSTALKGVVWTNSMRRMYCLLERCLAHCEPALLVGETGTGKTTVCQMAAFIRGQHLHIINCNQHTEVSDFLGGFRPNRNRERSLAQFQTWLDTINACPLLSNYGLQPFLLPPTPCPASLYILVHDVQAAVLELSKRMKQDGCGDSQQAKLLQEAADQLGAAAAGVRAPFEWVDGPLVVAMKRGDIILVDELNLAEDAVLERLNSVLEPGRTLTLAERGGAGPDVIAAHPNFRIVATMNPGGDYGKKELSPALSNRFTSVWVPAIEDLGELNEILNSKLADNGLREAVAPRLLEFWSFFKDKVAHLARQVLSVRDLLAWTHFITATAPNIGVLPAYAHGAHLVLLDGMGLGVGLSAEASQQLREVCQSFLLSQLPKEYHLDAWAAAGRMVEEESGSTDDARPASYGHKWGIAPFYIERDSCALGSQWATFNFGAPTTARNALRVLRALQLRKPVLLEGSPGVGKTSLVAAMAKTVGRELVRINLSEQTDMMDLLGADLPVEGGAPGEFAWSDGPLLRAIRNGAWVLLDELNLANQTVLEGLNAVLDHRAELFIPELGRTYRCPRSFRVFAAQNPLQEGGGRKGLPKSFLNRFMRVHVDLLQQQDLRFIAGALHPSVPSATVDRMVAFLQQLHHDANVDRSFATAGGPWEFNLRDLLRWCHLAEEAVPRQQEGNTRSEGDEAFDMAVQHYAVMLFFQRLRTSKDRSHASQVLGAIWGNHGKGWQTEQPSFHIGPSTLQIGWAFLSRGSTSSDQEHHIEDDRLGILSSQLHELESIAECVSRGWMCLLVGPASSGKTAIIRNLSLMCGCNLIELPLTSGTDTSDLLGGFEQVEPQRKIQDVGRLAQDIVTAATELILTSDVAGNRHALQGLQFLLQAWEPCIKSISGSSGDKQLSKPPSFVDPSGNQDRPSLQLLAQVATHALDLSNVLGASGALLAQQAQELAGRVQELKGTLNPADTAAAGKFEWVDGALTRAIERGQWVLLDNANLCNPTVLDRLNPLLEPQGELYLNECGTGTNGPRVLKPHPNFRLFLALDPSHGEVSRAMRNRGIEIFLLPDYSYASSTHPSQQLESACQPLSMPPSNSTLELETIVGFEGVPTRELPQVMVAAHAELAAYAMQRHRRPPSVRELKRWASLIVALGLRGWKLQAALSTAFDHVYVRGEIVEEARLVAAATFKAHFEGTAMKAIIEGASTASLFWPAVWPLRLSARAFASHSLLTNLARDGSILLRQLSNISCPIVLAERGTRQQPFQLDLSQSESQHLGVVAAALLPGRSLIGAVSVGEAPLRMEEADDHEEGTGASKSHVLQLQHAMLCLLAAARVFVERASPCNAAIRSCWTAFISLQVEQLLGQTAARHQLVQAAHNVGHIVEGVLQHPLVAELAHVHTLLAAELHLPHHKACLLPLDPTQTCQLQLSVSAAGLLSAQDEESWGGAIAGVWARMQQLAGKMHFLQAAVEAAVLMKGALEDMQSGAQAVPSTILQLSCWRFHHPKERARRAAPHSSVDWFYPALHAIQEAESALLQPATGLPWSDELQQKLSSMQEWRWALYQATHADPGTAAPEKLNLNFEALVFVWLRLSEAIQAVLDTVTASPATTSWAEGSRLAQISHHLGASFGLAGRMPDAPYLWKKGGRPLLPRSANLSKKQSDLFSLCEITRVGAKGFQLDHRQQPLLLSKAGVLVRALGASEGTSADLSQHDDLASAAESVAASVACNLALRSALLEGLCLFGSGAVTANKASGTTVTDVTVARQQEESLAEIPALLAAEVQPLAEAAASASLAFQRCIRSSEQARVQPSEGDEGPPLAPLNAVMTAVPDARAKSSADSSEFLPEILPAELMHYPSCRDMQLGLLALQDLHLCAAQLHAMGSGVLRLLCLDREGSCCPAHLLWDLESTVQRAVRSGCCNVATVAPYQQLLWILQVQPHALSLQQSGQASWQQLLLQSLVHEAWYGFHQSLWEGCAARLPAVHAMKVAPEVSEAWNKMTVGPMKNHMSVLSTHASAMVASSVTASVADRSATVLQLKLASRQLRRLAAARASLVNSPHVIAGAEWASAAAVTVSTLEVHLPAIENAEQRARVAEVLRWLVDVRCSLAAIVNPRRKQDEHADARLLTEVQSAFGTCSHSLLQALLPILVVPCLKCLLESTHQGNMKSGTEGVLCRGRVWAMLGLLRLHLSVPPVGSDPAAKYALLRKHLLSQLRLTVDPELDVRRQYKQLPGGPDETRRIAALLRRSAELQESAEKLEGRCVPRPVPPVYFGLRDEVVSFVEGLASTARMLPLIEALYQRDATAASEATVWQQNAGAWLDRVGEQFVGYRDVLQPVQLAVQEVRYGLSLLAGAACLSGKPCTSTADKIVSQLMSFPIINAEALERAMGNSLNEARDQQGSWIDCNTAQLVIAELSAVAARTDPNFHQEGLLERVNVARMRTRLRLLRISLHRQLHAVSVARKHSRVLLEAQLRLHAIFTEFVSVWEEIKAEEERRAAEDAEIFKSKTRSTEIATEEQEDEADYQAKFPEYFAAFADLAGDDGPSIDLGAQEPLQPRLNAANEGIQAAAYSARDLVQGEVLQELVAVHATAFASNTHLSGGGTGSSTNAFTNTDVPSQVLDADKEFLLSYELGTDVLRDSGMCLSGAVDIVAATGHLMATTLRHKQLTQPPSDNMVDMQAACVEEAVLVQRPLNAVQARLGELLEEWPDHPVLMQLSGIAGRVLAMPVTCPLKQLMTGVELLLARAQVWEDSAAKHVSLSAQLCQVSALATRWRKLELASWRGILQRTVTSFAQGAAKAWFHLYRILVSSTTSVAEVAAVVEQFMQACPVGEFNARLQLLHKFHGQLTCLSAGLDQQSSASESGARWKQLGAVLYNIHRYYAQFGVHVEKQIAAGLKQLEKELQDFVSLAKWEDRGFYAQRIAVEKAQRQLHRLTRRALQELKEPAGGVLRAVACRMGFNDLIAPALHLPELGSYQSTARGQRRAKDKKAAKDPITAAAAAAATDMILVGEDAAAAAAAAFTSVCQPVLKEMHIVPTQTPKDTDTHRTLHTKFLLKPGVAGAETEVFEGTKYAKQLPRLTSRFHTVVLTALKQRAVPSIGAAAIEQLAGDVAERALLLRADTERGARARKKKALTDLLKGLSLAGISRRRSAVPAAYKGVQSWFQQGGADAGPLLSASQGVASGLQLEAGAVAWAKADTYYFRTMARMQRLWEAANHPHADVAPHEVEAACRMSEHMIYLVQQGRGVLRTLCSCYAQLSRLSQLLGLLASTSGSAGELPVIPPQELAWNWYISQSRQLCQLSSLTSDTERLLKSAAAAEDAPTVKQLLLSAAAALEAVASSLIEGQGKLADTVQYSVELPSSHIFLPPAAVDQLQSNAMMLCECDAKLTHLSKQKDFDSEVPGWCTLMAAFSEAARAAATSAQQLQVFSRGPDKQPSMQQGHQELGKQLSDCMEGAVEAMLVWAQQARPNITNAAEERVEQDAIEDRTADSEAPEEMDALATLPIPELLRSLESCMQAARVQTVCSQVTAALAKLAVATGDPSNSALCSRMVAGLSLLAPMLSMLRCALCQLALQYLGALKATSKLSYICTSLFSGLVQEGFCMPEAEAEGDGGEGDGKMTEGTGLGEGDTRGAKDISEQLEEQDELLGAKQKGQEQDEQREDEQQQEDNEDKQQEEKGVEMDDDFEGSLEDMQQDPNAQSEGEEDEEGDEDRVDQQMGEAGADAEAVDERMWDEEDKEDQQGKQEDAGYDDETPLQVDDKSTLDYAAGQEKPEQLEGKEQGDKQEAQPQPQPQPQDEGDGAQEDDGEQEQQEDQEWGDYPDKQQEQEGHVQPEGPEQEFELPEDMNLDGGEGEDAAGGEQEEMEEEGAGRDTEEEGTTKEANEQGGDLPEGPDEQDGEPSMEEDGNSEGQVGDDGEQEPQLPPAVDGLPQAGEEEGEQEAPAEDMDMAEAQQAQEDAADADPQPPAEAGPRGLPSAAVAAAAAQQGVGEGEDEQQHAQQGEDDMAAPPHTGPPMPSGAEAPPEAGGSAAGAAAGTQRDMAAQQRNATGRDQPAAQQERQQSGMSEANPYRNLGSALERWRARLAMAADAEQPQRDDEGGQQEPEVSPLPEQGGDEEGAEGEYRFLGSEEGREQGDTQALAPATEEQAAATATQREQLEEEGCAAGMEEDAGEEAEKNDMADEAQQAQQEMARGQTNWGTGGGRKAGVADPESAAQEADVMEEEEGEAMHDEEGREGEDVDEGVEQDCREAGDSFVAAKLAATRLEDDMKEGEGEPWEVLQGLAPERAKELREQLEERLRASSDGTLAATLQGGAVHGQEVWGRCEALTSGLVGELTEQLRLILEPTLASKLAGDYRTGKRINMKKVISYIASQFRKDKIWLRRTRPDKRRYQVVVAVDDSRSMAETGTAGAALEALTLICRSMARLEVGELGVVSFGGSGGVMPLHPLEKPFTDSDGVMVMSQMRFDQDNTITDRPMVELITSLQHVLEEASARSAASQGGGSSLHQLVLIIADGRFHEKESLQRMVREATSQPGVLYAFIVLDNPENSILDMQTVSFVGGKPVFAKYMDSFPFPFYIVLRETAALPRTLADLLRQWFELSST